MPVVADGTAVYTVPSTVIAGPETRKSTVVLPTVIELATGTTTVIVTSLVVRPVEAPVPVAEADAGRTEPDEDVACDDTGIRIGFCV